MKRIQFKLNKRIFAVDIDDNIEDYDEQINEGQRKLIEHLELNNESIKNVFFECLEVVCSECGISLTNGEEEEDFVCLQCDAKQEIKR